MPPLTFFFSVALGAELEGEVRDPSGAPLAGVRVVAYDERLNYAVACRHDRIGCLALRRPDDHAVHIDAVLRYETTGGEGLWLRCSRLTGTLVAAAGPHGDGSATAATPYAGATNWNQAGPASIWS